jgi:hypothetical protein
MTSPEISRRWRFLLPFFVTGGADFMATVTRPCLVLSAVFRDEREAIVGLFVADISLIGRRELLLAPGGLLLLLILLEDRRRSLLGDRGGIFFEDVGGLAIGVLMLVWVGEGVSLTLLLPLVPLDAIVDKGDEVLVVTDQITEGLGLFFSGGIEPDGEDADTFDDATFCILSANSRS